MNRSAILVGIGIVTLLLLVASLVMIAPSAYADGPQSTLPSGAGGAMGPTLAPTQPYLVDFCGTDDEATLLPPIEYLIAISVVVGIPLLLVLFRPRPKIEALIADRDHR